MKRNVLIIAALSLSLFGLNAQKQINRFINPTTINQGHSGWHKESDGLPFTLAADGDAIKISPTDPAVSMSGKFQQRFTPSANGQYTLTFQAKKDAPEVQKMTFNVLALESWAGISSKRGEATIDSDEYKEYTVTFEYNNTANTKTIMPHGAQLEIYVDGIKGNVWLKDIVLTENNNNLIHYQDNFEKDLPSGIGTTNGWEGAATKLTTLGENTVLEFTQGDVIANDPWNVSFKRKFWTLPGVQFRVQFDVSATVEIPADNGVAVEIFDGEDRCLPTAFFEVTKEMKTVDFITKKTTNTNYYAPNMYVGRVPANEKLYFDNFMIAPIYLYNATVAKVEGTTAEITWLHSGYLAGDKLNVMLIDGEYEDLIAADIEIVDGKATIDLPEELETGEYQLKLVDAVGEAEFAVGNETVSDAFQYTTQTTGMELNAENNLNILVADGAVRIANCPAEAVVTVFSAEGKAIRTLNGVSTHEAIRLDAGVYVIRINDRAFKVAL